MATGGGYAHGNQFNHAGYHQIREPGEIRLSGSDRSSLMRFQGAFKLSDLKRGGGRRNAITLPRGTSCTSWSLTRIHYAGSAAKQRLLRGTKAPCEKKWEKGRRWQRLCASFAQCADLCGQASRGFFVPASKLMPSGRKMRPAACIINAV